MGKEPFEYSQAQTKVLDGESSQGRLGNSFVDPLVSDVGKAGRKDQQFEEDTWINDKFNRI